MAAILKFFEALGFTGISVYTVPMLPDIKSLTREELEADDRDRFWDDEDDDGWETDGTIKPDHHDDEQGRQAFLGESSKPGRNWSLRRRHGRHVLRLPRKPRGRLRRAGEASVMKS